MQHAAAAALAAMMMAAKRRNNRYLPKLNALKIIIPTVIGSGRQVVTEAGTIMNTARTTSDRMRKVFVRANSGRLCSAVPSFPSSSCRHSLLYQEFHAFAHYPTARQGSLQCKMGMQRRYKIDFQGKLAGYLEEVQR